MVPNRLALTAVAAGCLIAAGTGGYLAARQNAVGFAAAEKTTAAGPAAGIGETVEAQPVAVAAPAPAVSRSSEGPAAAPASAQTRASDEKPVASSSAARSASAHAEPTSPET